jgi:uncharacterized protein (TIGR02118 family)
VIKITLLLNRHDDMSADEFRRHWHGEHAELLSRLPGLQRLVLNDVLPGPDGALPPCDGISEDWFDSLEAMQAAFASPAGQAVAGDAANFVDLARMQMVVVGEHEVPLRVPQV